MNHDINILFFSRSHPYWGGVERWLACMVKEFRQQGFNVTLCLLEGKKFNNPRVFADSLQLDDYEVLSALSGAKETREYVIEKAIKKFKPDIVIPVLSIDALRIASKFKETYKYKLILPTHEFGAGVYADLEFYSKYIDVIVTVEKLSTAFLPWYLEIDPQKFKTIHACVDPDLELNMPPDDTSTRKTIGFCGRWAEDKAPEVAVQIFEDIIRKDNSILLRWVGLDKAVIREHDSLKKLISSGSLEVLGELRQSQMHDFYASIDCLLITSSHETGPLIAWEAMFQGVLVVTSEYLGLRMEGFLKNHNNCLVYPLGDVQAAVNAIFLAFNDDLLYKNLIKQAHSEVKELRSLDSMINKWDSLINETYTGSQSQSFIVIKNHFNGKKILIWLKELLRKKLKQEYIPHSPREEWPTHQDHDGRNHKIILNAMREYESSYYK